MSNKKLGCQKLTPVKQNGESNIHDSIDILSSCSSLNSQYDFVLVYSYNVMYNVFELV